MTLMPANASLTGEILSDADDIRVFAKLHPFRAERVERRFPAGSTLAEIVRAIAAESRFKPDRFQAHIEGHSIKPGIWHLVRPKPRTTVALHPVPGFFLAAIFGALGAAIASLGFFGQILIAGITIAANLLLNKLFAPRQKKRVSEEIRPSFSITGSRNTAAQYEPVPVILGTHRVTPFFGGLPFTESAGEHQYLRLHFVWGYGPLSISSIKVGNTLLSSFEDVLVETRQGLAGDAPVTLYTRQPSEETLSVELVTGLDYQRRTTAANVSEISVDVVLPNGLIWIADDGSRNQMGFGWGARYRLVGGGGWTVFKDEFFTRATQNIIRLNARVAVAAGTYEVEVARYADKYAGTNIVFDDATWTALRGFRPGPTVTFDSPVAITAVRIKASSQLNGVIDTLNGICTSLVTAWNGSSWVVNTASRNPADLYRHVLQHASNKRPRTDAQIDLVTLQAWHAYNVTNGWTFDMPQLSRSSVRETLFDICAAGRAMPVFKDGKWSVIWDEQTSPVVQMFTPRNSWGFESVKQFDEPIHGWRVRFTNAAKGYVEDERIVYDDGYTAANATRFEGLEFPGITNTNTIWKHGRYHIAQVRLRPETFTLNVDFENLICTRGDRVRVQHDAMLVGLGAGRVKSVDAGAQTVTLDEILTLDGSKSYMLRFRLADGTFLTRNIDAGSSGELSVIGLDGTSTMPVSGDLFTFGEVDSDTAVYRVLSIEPQDNLSARLSIVDDAPGIYLADTGAIPDYDSGITEPVDPFTLPPADLRLSSGAYLDGANYVAWVKLSWQQSRHGKTVRTDVEYLDPDSGSWVSSGSTAAAVTTFEIRGLDAGTYTFRVRNVFDDGTFSDWLTSPSVSLDELLSAPPDVTQFRIDTIGAQSTLSWTGVGVVGVSYEIRFAPITVASPVWNTAATLIPVVTGESVQVPTMVGTYFIKAALPNGTKSVTAASIFSNVLEITGLNIVELVDDGPTWPGTKENVAVRDGEIQLGFRDQMANWATLTSIAVLMFGDGSADSIGLHHEGIYYVAETVDLGAVYTARMSYELVARGRDAYNTISLWTSLSSVSQLSTADPAEWSVVLEYRSSVLAPAADVWSDWQPFVVGDVSARAYQYRLKLAGLRSTDIDSPYATTTPVVTSLLITVDMPDRTDDERDLTVTVAGRAITYPHGPFRAIPTVVFAIQDGLSGDRWIYTAQPTIAGFTVEIRDSGGSLVERTIDYVAKGYGGELA